MSVHPKKIRAFISCKYRSRNCLQDRLDSSAEADARQPEKGFGTNAKTLKRTPTAELVVAGFTSANHEKNLKSAVISRNL